MNAEFELKPHLALPHELERRIFVSVAEVSYFDIPAMRCVAWRVNQWVEPFFHCGLYVDYEGDFATPGWSPDLLTADIVRRPEFFAENVRHAFLSVERASQHPAALCLLAACTQIDTLEIRRGYPATNTPLLDHVLALAGTLTRLHVDFGDLISKFGRARRNELDPVFSAFKHITHLELQDTALTFEVSSRLERMPRLTHLAVQYDSRLRGTLTSLYTILLTCKRLEVLVGLQELRRTAATAELGDRYQAMEHPHYVDNNNPKFVVVRYVHRARDDPRGWLHLAREGGVAGYWPCAEEVVARRLAELESDDDDDEEESSGSESDSD
uniref:F-box domain-containing protein n=1 Tax=Mycena chlorophos TaxID=658473 RepID=A0ABQ0MB25_MYCCL|nr:predicted protein [Mycena chlorophos]